MELWARDMQHASMATHCLTPHEHRHIVARSVDVEDIGVISITYSDGTKAAIMGSDVVLGGTKNYIEIYCNDTALMCNITPTDILTPIFLKKMGWKMSTLRKCCRQSWVGIRPLSLMKLSVVIWVRCRTLWNVWSMTVSHCPDLISPMIQQECCTQPIRQRKREGELIFRPWYRDIIYQAILLWALYVGKTGRRPLRSVL